jgi:NADPH-dependent 2,4-dienoyl-CoA reductase/sulfur reductase-like enzyme
LPDGDDKLNAVVVVGAGLAGSRVAETLRSQGYDGRVVLVGEESALPYERPALSKELLAGKKSKDQIVLRRREYFAERQIELELGERVVEIDVERREARLASGRVLSWDALVLATGARARRLRSVELPSGVHYLRTLDDALALRAELEPGRRLAIVGAGFIGTEVASTALALGLDVAIVEAFSTPLLRQLGAEVGSILAERYRDYGVDLRLDTGLASFAGDADGRVSALLLDDGSEIACDLALVGIGAEPVGELLGAGEIATDASGRTAIPGVFSCGDVASAWRPSLGKSLRIEHWSSAAGQAAAVAQTILGEEAIHDDVPFFWSDQFDLRLQHVGHAENWERVEIDGTRDEFSARYIGPDDRLLSALLVNRPAETARLRRELRESA